MIRIEYDGTVAIVKLDRDVTNALNLDLVTELDKTLQVVKQDAQVHSLVLTSTHEKFFSIGFDIPQLYELSKNDFSIFYKAFNRLCMDLYTVPKMTVAAITGHAVAGGCILALCCDYRFIAEGKKKMGLNEIKLGVPIPYPADCMLRQIVGFRNSREIVDSGNFYLPEKLLHLGLIDEIFALDKVLPEAIEKAKLIEKLSPDAFAFIKRNRVEEVVGQISSKLREKEQIFLELWYSNEVRDRLKIAMEKF
jgi:enoyl-CoA hydratase/carnithine racemase